MASPLRLILVADSAAAGRAVEPVRRRTEVEAAMAPSAAVLGSALREAALRGMPWSAVLFCEGGPVSAAEVATVMHGQSVPLIVVGVATPPPLAAIAAAALDEAGLEALPDVLASVAAREAAAASTAFIGAANAALAQSAEATARLPGALAVASAPIPEPPAPTLPPPPPVVPPPVVSRPAAPVEARTPPPPRPAVPRPSLSREAESLAQHLPIGVYRSTPDGRVAYANPALAEVLGVDSVEALASLDVRTDIGYPRAAFAEQMRRSGTVRNLTVRWTNPRGQAIVTRENARAVVDARGQIVCYEGTLEDVTAEIEARDAVRDRARRHEAVVRFAEAADGAAAGQAIYEAAVQALLDATQASWVLFARRDLEKGNVAAAWAGAFPAAAAHVLNTDPTFTSFQTRPGAMLVRDVETAGDRIPPSLAALMRANGARSVGLFPLFRAGTPLGTLIVGHAEPHTFAAGERETVEVLAWHLAGHIARTEAERELRASEASLRDSETSLRFIADHSGQVLYRLRYTSGAPRFDYLSPAVEVLTGFAPDELAARGGVGSLVESREVFAGDGLLDGPLSAAHYHAVYRIRTRSGDERYVENHAYPWHDQTGAAVGLVGALQDVTERTHRENALADAAQQTLARQGALVELARTETAAEACDRTAELACEVSGADAASVWLADGPWMVCRALYDPRRLDDDDLVTPSYPADAFEAALADLNGQRSLAIGDAGEDARVDRAGFRPLVDALGLTAFVASPVRSGSGTVGMVLLHRTEAHADTWATPETEFAGALADAVALAVERDERAEAEQALRRSEARYRVLSDLTSDYAFAIRMAPGDAPDAMLSASAIEWATESFSRISGYAPDEVRDIDGFLSILHPDSRDVVVAAVAGIYSGQPARFEARIQTRDGETRWVEHSARLDDVRPDGTTLVYHSGQDVTERKRFESDLVSAREQAETSREEAETAREEAEAAREEAEQMARLKTAFLANMSHEIRTPLTGILGYAELLATELDGEHRLFVDAITNGGTRLLNTLNSVLDLARLESNGVRPDLARLDLAAEVRAAVAPLRALALRRGLTLDVHAPDSAEALLDAHCLGRIATNLVGNAIKFTESGGVRVDVEAIGGRVLLRVSDTGVGISESFLPHLFDEFRQETDGPARTHEGSGLGLSITRKLVELMDGRIEVASRRPGGSIFTVSFPALAPVPSPSPFPPMPATSAPVFASLVGGDGAARAAPDIVASGVSPPEPTLAFSFASPASSVPAATVPPAPAQTSMFDFRFSSKPAPAPPAPDEAPAAVTPAAAVPASAAPVPVAPAPEALTPETAPVTPSPAWPVDTSDGSTPPVMIVRPHRDEPTPGEPTPADPPPLPAADPGDMRPPVLVVEDNLDTRMLLERILRSAYNVTAVGDARSALSAMAQTRFRGFVLDINLGGKETGTDVLRIARSLDGYSDVFAIALTAYALPGDRDRLLESGFNEYISKPFTRQSLMDALAAGIGA